MKKLLITVLIGIGAFLFLNSFIPTEKEVEIYNSTVRIHVIANSDSEEDQALKLMVRDKILEEVVTYRASDKEEALNAIRENKAELTALAREALLENGCTHSVSIEIGNEDYPTRYYEDFALPAGNYTSVRVVLGEGEGENWWCVLYPPICTSAALEYDEDSYIQVGLTKDQYTLITGETTEYKVKFKLLELAKEAFGFSRDSRD